MNFQLTLRNYRCFGDKKPAAVDFSEGLTALVGPNNSGKSTILRSFYELSKIWDSLQYSERLGRAFQDGNTYGANFDGVQDANEIFHDHKSGVAHVELKFLEDSSEFQRVRLEFNREKRDYMASFAGPKGEFQRFPLGTPIQEGVVRVPGKPPWNPQAVAERFRWLGRILYVGAARTAETVGEGSVCGLAQGGAFCQTWQAWKTGRDTNQKARVILVEQQVADLFGFKSCEINANFDRNALQVNINGKSRSLYEVGAGLSQVIVALAHTAIKSPSMVLIDEPESHLHPALQMKFLQVIAMLVPSGRVAFCTHSIGLARATAERIYKTSMVDGVAKVEKFESNPTDVREFLGEMSYSAFTALGALKILFVEGIHDVPVVQHWLRLCGKDHEIVVWPYGGDRFGNAHPETLSIELKRLGERVAIVVDSERQNSKQRARADRKIFYTACKKAKLNVFLTDKRAIENYFPDQAVKKALGNAFVALQPYEDLAKRWDKAKNALIAREMTLPDLARTSIGRFLRNL